MINSKLLKLLILALIVSTATCWKGELITYENCGEENSDGSTTAIITRDSSECTQQNYGNDAKAIWFQVVNIKDDSVNIKLYEYPGCNGDPISKKTHECGSCDKHRIKWDCGDVSSAGTVILVLLILSLLGGLGYYAHKKRDVIKSKLSTYKWFEKKSLTKENHTIYKTMEKSEENV